VDALDPGEIRRGQGEAVEVDPAGREVDASGEGVLQGLGLVVDLLGHEVLVATLLGLDRVPVEHLDRPLAPPAGEVGEHDAGRGDPGEVAVLEEDHPPGVGEDGGRVGGEELLALAEPEDEGGAVAGGDDLAHRLGAVARRRRRRHGGEGVHPLELGGGGRHRREEAAAVEVA
jgi:hypothetical protein